MTNGPIYASIKVGPEVIIKEGSLNRMKGKEVSIGKHYAIRHFGEKNLSVIRLDSHNPYGGYNATKLKTNRTIRIRSAAKLRFEVVQNPKWPTENPKWVRADRIGQLDLGDL